MNDLHAFHVASKTWSKVNAAGKLPKPRMWPSAVLYEDALYGYGGKSTRDIFNDLFTLDFGASCIRGVSMRWCACSSFLCVR